MIAGTDAGPGRQVIDAQERAHVDADLGDQHRRNHPVDALNSEWIADLVRHGLIAKSFVPPRPLREMRELLRYRRKLVESQAAERNGS